GVMDTDILDLIRLNVRVPDQVLGDIHANVSCTAVVVRQTIDFMQTYGLDTLEPLARPILDQTEAAVRACLAALPDGDYQSEADVEALDQVRRLRCQISKRGDTLEVAFEGTEGCIGAGINVPFPYTKAMVLYAIKCLTTPGIPNNDGATTPITVSAPVDSILNARPPAPSAGRHAIGHFIVPLVFEALAPILPQQVCAASGLIDILTFQGRTVDGQPMAATYFAAGGFGAMAGLDGRQTLPGSTNMGSMSIELFEPLSDITVERKQLRADSGGDGEFRGGAGQTIVLRNDSGHDLTVFTMGNRTQFAAEGLFGGEHGARREYWIDDHQISGQGKHRMQPGQRLRLEQAGGGGYGPAGLRTQAARARDIANGFVSPPAKD
ncbi:MAG: hydantoinase B/oxoprolinase family protein, partial [Gemmobacter sp.]|nr:hydantoinase B/oxoprolinase family protein [Gemmobacter sp.]